MHNNFEPRGGTLMNNRQLLRKERAAFSIMWIPPFALYTCLFVLPVVAGLCYSFTDWNGFSREIHFNGIQNYLKLFQDRQFHAACIFNLKYTVLLTVFSLGIAMLLATAVCSKIRFQKFFRLVFFFPACLSLVTIGLVFNEIFYQGLPQLGQALGWNWLSRNILSSEKTAMYGVLFVHVWKNAAIPFILFVAGIQGVPQSLYEAAKIDGANVWQCWRRITLPMLLPMITVAGVLSIKEGLTVFDYIVIMTSGGPGGATESLAYLIYNNAFKNMKLSYSVAQSVVVFLLLCIASALQFWLAGRNERE